MNRNPNADSVVLFLAAGASRRFGQDKRLALLYKGQSLLRASLQPYLDADCEVCVCLSASHRDAALACELASLPVRVLRCRRAEEGMGGTLAEAALECRSSSAFLVALADMPLIRSSTIRAMLAQAGPGRIVVPVHGGRRGHPVLFDSSYGEALRKLRGDRGAAALLTRHAASVREVSVEDPGIHRDADTPAALSALRRDLT